MTNEFIQRLGRDGLSENMLAASQPYEERFQEKYDTFLLFSKDLFSDLHEAPSDPHSLPAEVTVASKTDSSILADMEILKKVANSALLTVEMKREYYSTIKAIYSKLPNNLQTLAAAPESYCVGIEREGRIIAEALGCLPEARSLIPHAKRIPFEGGLIVGLRRAEPPVQNYDNCVLIDGAIASGATLMSMMWLLQHVVKTFHIYSIHGPCEGLRAIVKCAHQLGVGVSLVVGHATVGLNEQFYAVDETDGHSLILGDVGDTISDLDNPSAGH